ncbi:unnamed protein product [Rhizophagus irregularis]|uniref:Uncharacterized protein n=1 Tax=Rhizophagus irregularis TaxID=588596 RepID=A0A915ZXG1_9GLOM|nr:unnamed protein product [Rhizophagus irregularis]CAB5394013.1 unnamed protein product [Rhizophagus irregularis]
MLAISFVTLTLKNPSFALQLPCIAYTSKFTSGYLLLILDVQLKQHSIIVGTALIIMLLIGAKTFIMK